MKSLEIEKVKTEMEPVAEKKPYEKPVVTEHEPLQEAVATTYYYYTYGGIL